MRYFVDVSSSNTGQNTKTKPSASHKQQRLFEPSVSCWRRLFSPAAPLTEAVMPRPCVAVAGNSTRRPPTLVSTLRVKLWDKKKPNNARVVSTSAVGENERQHRSPLRNVAMELAARTRTTVVRDPTNPAARNGPMKRESLEPGQTHVHRKGRQNLLVGGSSARRALTRVGKHSPRGKEDGSSLPFLSRIQQHRETGRPLPTS